MSFKILKEGTGSVRTEAIRDVAKFYDKDMIHQYSSAVDIVASYLKGQKIIYMESAGYNVFYLNCFHE